MRKTAIKLAAVALSAATALTPLTAAAATIAPDSDFSTGAAEWISAEESGFDADSLTLQPGETTESVNFNWYAPAGTADAKVKFTEKKNPGGFITADAEESALRTPTKVDGNKYTDTGKIVCEATVQGLSAGTEYTYQISNDGGITWSKEYTYTTPETDSFKFAFTSDPQIKEDRSTNSDGWNPSDGANQTGWAKMMETISGTGATLVVSAGDQVEDQSWGKSSEYEAFFAPEEMASIAYAPAVGNHDRHYMFDDHFNLPNEMSIANDGAEASSDNSLTQVKTSFRGQNNGTSQSHGNYIQATEAEISAGSESNGVTPNADGQYDFTERREMETKGNYYYLYGNVLFVTLNTGAYPGGNDEENAGNESVPSASKDNSEAEAIVENFRKTVQSAKAQYEGQYDWLIVTHHKSTQTVAKHAADSDIENYVDAGFEQLMAEEDVDFVLGGHDHVYSRSYVLNGDGEPNSERLDTLNDPDGVIYLTGNCCSDMQYYTPFTTLDKTNNSDYPKLANGKSGSQAYLEGNLPLGNQEWNQEYSPSYAIFDVTGGKISVTVYNLDGDSENPDSKPIDAFTVTKNADGGEKTVGEENGGAALDLIQEARYDAGMSNADGGVMEIVDYSTATGWAYAVNGQSGNLTAIDIKNMEDSKNVDLLDGNDIDIKAVIEEKCSGFVYGDMTSVAVSPDGTKLAVAIQAGGYADTGRAALFACNADGTLTFEAAYETGVQPDMITFTPDGNKILTANEGEPREGYSGGATDPEGTVTVISVAGSTGSDNNVAGSIDSGSSTAGGSVHTIGFHAFDSAEKRQKLTDAGIILKKGADPSVDFEPEYIAATDSTAYVTLQEANAVAVIDLESLTVTGVYSAGYEDYSKTPVDIDKEDETYKPQTYDSLMGIRMPDSIALYTAGGVDYVITANEGDSREWGGYLNEDERNFKNGETSPTGKITAENSGLNGKVVFFDSRDYDGLSPEKDYLFGGRSFTAFRADENGLTEVYDSGSDFEARTFEYIPDNFNCSNDDKSIDDRSGKKGPEAESVTVGNVNGRTYAFIGLERIGGVMVYDITDPEESSFVNYINSRDFSEDIAGDDSPEGLSFISADDSSDGSAYLLAACEVSGTVAAYKISGKTNGTGGSHSSGGGGSASTAYDIDISASSGGTVTASPSGAKKGQTVTLTAAPQTGFELEEITVTAEDGTKLTVERKDDNIYTFTMPASDISVSVIFGKTGGSPLPFDDVSSDDWFADSVAYVCENGMMTGTDSRTFSPNSTTTRGMIVTMLYRLEGEPSVSVSSVSVSPVSVSSFADVAPDAYYADAVAWAEQNDIVNGYDSETFAPNDTITREQLAEIFYRYAGYKNYDTEARAGLDKFADSKEISSYAQTALSWANAEKLVNGVSGSLLSPKGSATRAEAAAILTRFCQEIAGIETFTRG